MAFYRAAAGNGSGAECGCGCCGSSAGTHVATNKPKGGAVRFNEQPSQLSATLGALN